MLPNTLYAVSETEKEGLYKGYKKTIVYDGAGKIVATYPAGIKQPSRLKKTIVHNCFTYNLLWRTPLPTEENIRQQYNNYPELSKIPSTPEQWKDLQNLK